MTKLQTIKSPSGDELVVMSRADYEALVDAARGQPSDVDEDAEDLAIAEERMAEFVAAGSKVMPREVSEGLLRDESLLKAVRKWRGLKQGEVAQRAGLAQGYLADLESRRRKGTPETLQAIASVLDVPTDWLSTAPAP